MISPEWMGFNWLLPQCYLPVPLDLDHYICVHVIMAIEIPYEQKFWLGF